MHRVALLAYIAVACSASAESGYGRYGRVIWYNPEALPLIRTADEVYICPVTLSDKKGEIRPPRGDFKHLRLLQGDARRKLQCLLGTKRNWFHGSDNTVSVGYDPRTVGFVFRKGADTLVLLCGLGWRLEGKFNREPTSGSLEEKPFDQLEKWKRQYAKPELTTR
jgi:hypothetical protein